MCPFLSSPPSVTFSPGRSSPLKAAFSHPCHSSFSVLHCPPPLSLHHPFISCSHTHHHHRRHPAPPSLPVYCGGAGLCDQRRGRRRPFSRHASTLSTITQNLLAAAPLFSLSSRDAHARARTHGISIPFSYFFFQMSE